MSRSFDGVSDSLNIASAVFDATSVETTPISMACWVKRGRTGAAAEEFLMCGGASTLGSHYLALLINPANTVSARTRTSSNANATSSVTITDTTSWHLLVAVFAGTASRTIYVDGNAGVQDTTARDPTTASVQFAIGARPTTSDELQGLVAYATVWNKALTSGEVASLWNSGAGVDPTTIAGANLIAHWDLTGNESPEIDDVGVFDLTVTSATFSADNPFTVGGSSDTPITVTAGQLVLEPQNVGTLFTQAYAIPVQHGQFAIEGQEIPFILTQPYTDGELALEGQDVALVSIANAGVDAGQLALQGQTIGLNQAAGISVDAGMLALSGQVISLRATGLPSRGNSIIHRRRR